MSSESFALVTGGVLLLLSFLAFSVRQLSTGRFHHPRVQKDGGSIFFGGTYLMDFAYWMFSPLVKVLVSLKISPNVISLVCLLVSSGAGVAFAFGEFALAGWLWVLGSVMDALDGLVARTQKIATRAGSVIDSTVDRVAEFAVFGGLAYYYREQPWILMVCLTALSGSFLTSYISAKAEILRVAVPRGVMRRAERAVYIGAAALLSPLVASWMEPASAQPQHYLMIFVLALIALFSFLSSGYRLWSLCQTLDQQDESKSRQ